VRDGGGPIRALWATAAAGIEGERERELRGIDPLPHLERRWHVAAWPRWPAAAGGGGSGGGARGAEERLGRRRWLVVAKSVAEAPFIEEMRRWGWGEPVVVSRCGQWASGERCGAVLWRSSRLLALGHGGAAGEDGPR
jgi:hypothetical protein